VLPGSGSVFGDAGWILACALGLVNRDPRDGLFDVVGEDSWLNRNIWYRVDDRDIRVLTGKRG